MYFANLRGMRRLESSSLKWAGSGSLKALALWNLHQEPTPWGQKWWWGFESVAERQREAAEGTTYAPGLLVEDYNWILNIAGVSEMEGNLSVMDKPGCFFGAMMINKTLEFWARYSNHVHTHRHIWLAYVTVELLWSDPCSQGNIVNTYFPLETPLYALFYSITGIISWNNLCCG